MLQVLHIADYMSKRSITQTMPGDTLELLSYLLKDMLAVRPALTVHNSAENIVGTNEEKARIIKEYFEAEFNGANEPPFPPSRTPPRALTVPSPLKD